MAGFFGLFDFTKPGPGVPKDAPPKARIIVFFEIFSRKFWNLVKINIMFNIFNLPAIIGALFVTHFIFQNNVIPGDAIDPDRAMGELFTRFMISTVFLCIPVVTVGPAQAGFTYILRNYAREEHAFIWWDFKDNAIKNFKESLIICVIDFIALIVMGIAINFYLSFKGDNLLMSFASGILIISFVVFLMMHLYMYPMLVTFKLTVRQVYKNALVFSMIKFFPNLGILLLCIALLFVSLGFYPVIGIILYMFITVSTIGLITNFYVYPKLKKYIIDKIEGETSEEDESYEGDETYEEDETYKRDEFSKEDPSSPEDSSYEEDSSYSGDDSYEGDSSPE